REYATLPAIESIALYTGGEVTRSGTGTAERLRALLATPTLDDVLRVQPMLGRWFTAEEGADEGSRVAILSHGIWQSRFGASPAALGGEVRLDGEVYQIVGVMPPGFAFPEPGVEVLLPLVLPEGEAFGGFNFQGVARLRPGSTVEEA